MNKNKDSDPAIRTELPGPKARALLARDAEVVSPSYPREYPFVMSHGRGVEVWDVDGNRFLDFAAGIAVCSTGHSHPQVVQAIKNAADEFLHISPDFSHERQVALGEKINALSPMGEPVLSFFCQSGTEAVEGALKLARYVSGRSRFIGFLGGLRQLCNRHGIFLILDEVQSGVGRSGRMFACQHWDVQPDIMTLAKGLGSGLPIGLVVAKKTIMQQWKPGAHANTYGGNPLCCAAALVTLDLIDREYAANAEKVGTHF